MKFNHLFVISLVFIFLVSFKDKEVIPDRGIVNYTVDGVSGTFIKSNSRIETLLAFGNDKKRVIGIVVTIPQNLPVVFDKDTEESIAVTYTDTGQDRKEKNIQI